MNKKWLLFIGSLIGSEALPSQPPSDNNASTDKSLLTLKEALIQIVPSGEDIPNSRTSKNKNQSK